MQYFPTLLVFLECGAQFSLALSSSGQVWTWGKGDYFRLGHNSDSHVRRPQVVEALREWKIVDVAVGALHCLAVTDGGLVSEICKTIMPARCAIITCLRFSVR